MSFRPSFCQTRGKASRKLICWRRNLQRDRCGPERDWQRFQRPPDQIVHGQKFWRKLGKAAQNREKQNGHGQKPSIDESSKVAKPNLVYCIQTTRNSKTNSELHEGRTTGKICGTRDDTCIRQPSIAISGIPMPNKCIWEEFQTQCKAVQWNLMTSTKQCSDIFAVPVFKKDRIGKKSKSKKEVILQAQRDNKKVPFASSDGHVSPQKFGVRTQITEVWRQRPAPGTQCKRRLWSVRSIYWTRLVCIPNWLLQKWWTLEQDYKVVMDKQLMQHLPKLR